MCSIAGLHSPRVNDPHFVAELLPAWHAMLRHRGPDDWGWRRSARHALLLFNSRLAVTGLANGRQPLANERGTVWLTFNGEIYDYQEQKIDLERRGHRFRSDTDGEVIIHRYEEEGVEAVKGLAGEFAFALYDADQGLLFLVRDRFGIKPLYYAHTPEGFYFGSEIKAIFADPAFPRRFDPEMLQNQLQTFFFDTETVFERVRQVPPGHYLTYDLHARQYRLDAYWQLPVGAPPVGHSEEDQIEQFRFLFERAIRRRIPWEVPFGVYLSGGLDSSSLTHTLADLHETPFSVFSIGFDHPDYNELSYARKVAEQRNLPQHVVQIGKGDLQEAFLRSIWHSETPVLNPHGAAKQLLARAAREQVKVVLTGDGADEILWGYTLFAHLQEQEEAGAGRAGKKGAPSMSGSRLSGKLKGYEETIDFFGAYPYSMQRHFYLRKVNPFLLSSRCRRAGAGWTWQEAMRRHFAPGYFRGLTSAEATLLLLLRTDFPSYLLNYLGDRQEMAASLEGRVPFLDHELVEYICSLPAQSKLRHGAGKYILRAAMRGRLDEQIRTRSKQAFYAPALESLGFFADPEYYRAFIRPEKFREVGVFNPLFFSAFAGVVRWLPRRSPLTPVAESIVVFVLSLHMVHDLFIQDYERWRAAFAPVDGRLELKDHAV